MKEELQKLYKQYLEERPPLDYPTVLIDRHHEVMDFLYWLIAKD